MSGGLSLIINLDNRMNTRTPKLWGFILLSTILLSNLTQAKPNLIVILADDLGYGDLGCYGARYKTPVIDQMAAEGMRFTNLILPANVCSPSRAALLTGRYPMRNGHPFVLDDGEKCGLHPAELTIPELLKPAGYRSLAVGKWHLGLEFQGAHPLDAGFDEFLGLKGNYPQPRGSGAEGGAKGNTSTLYRGRKVEAETTEFEELTTRYTDEVVSFIGRQKEAPFFIYMAHHIAHTPVKPSKAFDGTSGGGNYGDFVSELDHSVGRVLKAVKDSGQDANTLVVLLSDNGPTGRGSAGPLLGGKYVTTEGGHRVPGIFRWPGEVPTNQVNDTMISSMDLLPLCCGLAGAQLPRDRKMDGANILDVIKGESKVTPHKFLYYYNGTNLQAVRQGKWKLHLPRTSADQPYWAKRGAGTDKKPMTVLKEKVLFDLEADIGETKDVAAENPQVVALLLKEAQRIRTELGETDKVGTDQRPRWP